MKMIQEILGDHPFFRGMKPAHLDLVSQCAERVSFNTGEFLTREGDPACHFFLLQKGTVALEAHEFPGRTPIIQELGSGEVLGWSWLFPPFVWHFQARARSPVEAIALNGAHLLIAAERDHDFGYNLMKRVAQVTIHRLQATRKQLFATRFPPDISEPGPLI